MSNVRYRQIVREYERRFRHKVRLENCRTWRLGYVGAQLAYLDRAKEAPWWSVGDSVSVYGFMCPVHAAILTDWSKRCGIDWSIAPELQSARPPGPSEALSRGAAPARGNHAPNLHSLANRGHPLGVECKACGHRALIPLDQLGADRGNMREVSTLRLKCSSCESRKWGAVIFNSDEEAAAFVQFATGRPTF
jgi:hypothetical protein